MPVAAMVPARRAQSRARLRAERVEEGRVRIRPRRDTRGGGWDTTTDREKEGGRQRGENRKEEEAQVGHGVYIPMCARVTYMQAQQQASRPRRASDATPIALSFSPCCTMPADPLPLAYLALYPVALFRACSCSSSRRYYYHRLH